jgi:hypothetical protein
MRGLRPPLKRGNMKVVEINGAKFKPSTDAQRAEVQAKVKKMQKEGEKLVKGMFEFIDAQAGYFDFCYRFFPGEPIRSVRITHGEICELPMVLVKHLNNCYKKVRTMAENLDFNRDSLVKTSRTRFTPVDLLE